MKSKSRVIKIMVLALTGVALLSVPAFAARGRGGAGVMGGGRGMGPAFTDEQMEKIQQIHERYNDQRVELTNRMKVLMLEADEVIDADNPDFNAIERKMDEIADVRLSLSKLRLQIHKEIRPLLNDDQKALFDRGLGRLLRGHGDHRGMMGGRTGGRGMRGGFGGMRSGCGMMGGPGMQGGRGGMGGPGMQGGPGAMGGAGMQGGPAGMNPWCPFYDAPDAEEE
jgi:Spy/CpxP family protein refolding chaperone